MPDKGFAFVTGGGSGIGRASAIALARRGFDVLIADLSYAAAEETARLIADTADVRLVAAAVDVTDPGSLEHAIAEGQAHLGRLSAAVNSAGVQGELAGAADCSRPNWDLIIGVNLTGTFLSVRAQIAAMLGTGGGSIVNIASNFGLVGQRGMPAYCASKHGVIGLSKSAALDYADRGVRVNVVCPGPIGTPLLDSFVGDGGSALLDGIKASVPMGRIGEAAEVGSAVSWLSSDEAAYVTGAVLSVDGGYVVP